MLPKAHLTSHSRMFGSRWVITPSWLSWSWRSFLYSSFVYSCHLFLIPSTSVRSIQFLSFILPALHEAANNCMLYGILVFYRLPNWFTKCIKIKIWYLECLIFLSILITFLKAILTNSFLFCCLPLSLCTDQWGRLSYLSLLFFGILHSDGFIFPFLLSLCVL